MVIDTARARSSSGQSTGLRRRSPPDGHAAGETSGPVDLTPAEHDRLHWLAGEVIAGRITLAEAERLAVRL